MPKNFIFHTTLLILATFGVFLWLLIPSLTPYTFQLVALLVLLYLSVHWFKNHSKSTIHHPRSTITLDITILTSMILLLISETSGLASPFFFLCYFLLFGVAMLYEIEATLVLTGVLILFFIFTKSTLSEVEWVTQIISLIMITPLAIFTGHQYETTLHARAQSDQLSKNLTAEESDILLFLSLNLKRTLLSALDALSLTIPKTGAKEIRTNLQTLYQDLKTLYRSADELQQTIDHETDS